MYYQLTFVWSEVWVDKRECSEKTSFIDKRQESHTLPCKLLTIQINFEVGRIEINDGRILWIEKEKWNGESEEEEKARERDREIDKETERERERQGRGRENLHLSS